MATGQMDTDDWKAYHDQQKQVKEYRLKRHTTAIRIFAEDHKLKMTLIQDSHIRITGNDKIVDFYPMSKRFHNISTGLRGNYHNLIGFLTATFGDEKRKDNKQYCG